MLRHLDQDARAVINLANRIAHEGGLEYVGTEHILLALLRHGRGGAFEVLRKCDVDEFKAQEAIDRFVESSKQDTWVLGRLPGSPNYRRVIEEAIEEAGHAGAKQIRTEHLLLGLLREEGTTAQLALTHMGATMPRCRKAVEALAEKA